MKTLIVFHYKRIKDFYGKYERLLMSAMLIGGFLVDFVAFVSIDIVFKFTVLVLYWLLAGVAIAFMQLYDAQKVPQRFKYVRLFAPLAVQFTFGGLLNISLIFYWFSGAFAISWPVLIIIVVLLICNDTFRHYFTKPLVQIGVYFFATLSLLSLLLLFLFNSLSPWLFVAAGAFSLAIFWVYIYWLSAAAGYLQAQKQWLIILIVIITGVMNVFYFTNIIPPIPLALREAGVYHSLTVSQKGYVMTAEPKNFLETLKEVVFGQIVHIAPAEKAYLYTAIFAPSNLKTTIIHRWQYYDFGQKKWVDRGSLPFIINGGRKNGYKGYSWQNNLTTGRWRVYVQNQRGQVLAIVHFNVESVDMPVYLQKVIR